MKTTLYIRFTQMDRFPRLTCMATFANMVVIIINENEKNWMNWHRICDRPRDWPWISLTTGFYLECVAIHMNIEPRIFFLLKYIRKRSLSSNRRIQYILKNPVTVLWSNGMRGSWEGVGARERGWGRIHPGKFIFIGFTR